MVVAVNAVIESGTFCRFSARLRAVTTISSRMAPLLALCEASSGSAVDAEVNSGDSFANAIRAAQNPRADNPARAEITRMQMIPIESIYRCERANS